MDEIRKVSEELKRARRPERWEFDKLQKELVALLDEDELKKGLINIKFQLLSEVYEKVQHYDAQLKEQFVRMDLAEEDEQREVEDMMEIKSRFQAIRLQKETAMPTTIVTNAESNKGSNDGVEKRVRPINLPIINPPTFSGELLDWLDWWSQFKKIDEDSMAGSDKFQYLMQYLKPGTDAFDLVKDYPKTDENYGKAIKALKKRYANEDMLLQVYIRQLLTLVIKNATSKEKIPVKALHLKLDSHLRALRTLKLEKADPATWLFPLVESSLPEKILDNWQRSPLSTYDGSVEEPPRTRLDLLLNFLEKEVEISQKIEITRAFASDQSGEKKSEQQPRQFKTAIRRFDRRPEVPTLAFHNAEKRSCVFCGKSNHDSKSCYRAKEMSYEKRMEFLKKNNLCFRCCGEHFGRECQTANLRCQLCGKQHFTILCKQFIYQPPHNNHNSNQRNFKRQKLTPTKEERPSTSSQTTRSNANVGSSREVALQTLLVRIVNGAKQILVRAFIDSGCEKSYISSKAAKYLELEPMGSVRAMHHLFGGQKTKVIVHNLHIINMQAVNSDFILSAEVREQEKICERMLNPVPLFPNIVAELQRNNIQLSDVNSSAEIDLLIGADLYPNILTEVMVRLSCGAAAIFTKLGWTVLGKLRGGNRQEVEESAAHMCISMAAKDEKIASLWELETLGIKEPAEEQVIKELQELLRENYISSISREPDGRYSAKLPWKENLPHLPSNRAIVNQRLISTTKKLNETGMFEKYDKVFREWANMGVIERTILDKENKRAHYLPHRPIFKMSSTTPVRPECQTKSQNETRSLIKSIECDC